ALREALARTKAKAKGRSPEAPPEARARALRDLGLYLHHVAPADAEQREDEELLEQAAQLAPGPAAARALALVSQNLDDRRRALEGGKAAAERSPLPKEDPLRG